MLNVGATLIFLPLATLLTAHMTIVAAPPPTEKKRVTDEYHGVKVADDYRWLEETGTPAVKVWTATFTP